MSAFADKQRYSAQGNKQFTLSMCGVLLYVVSICIILERGEFACLIECLRVNAESNR